MTSAATAADVRVRLTSSRTRSIWWNQLVLAAGVIVISVVILTVTPERFASSLFAAGVAGILALTAITVAVPWSRLPRSAVFVVPFLDIGCVGLLAADYDLLLGLLWSFPVIWVGAYASLPLLAAALTGVVVLLAALAPTFPMPASIVPIAIVVVATAFLGITAAATARRSRAFRRLVRVRAARHRADAVRLVAEARRRDDLIDLLTEGVARLDAGGRLVEVNAAYARLYDLDRDDLMQPARGVEYTDARTPLAETDRPVRRAGRGERFADERVHVFGADGRWRVLAVSSHDVSRQDDDPSVIVLARVVDVASQGEVPDGGQTSGEARRRLDLGGVLAASAQSFRQAAAAADVTIETQLDEPLEIDTDPFVLRQAIDHLVSNAVRYTGQGGRVFVSGRMLDDEVVATVTDTGIGMSADDLARAFDPAFRSGDAEALARGRGLGLGLARTAIEAEGGTVVLDSRPRAGTTATVRLRAAAGAASPATTRRSARSTRV